MGLTGQATAPPQLLHHLLWPLEYVELLNQNWKEYCTIFPQGPKSRVIQLSNSSKVKS